MGRKKKGIAAKILILSDEELKPIRDKIAEALAMLIDLIDEKGEALHLSVSGKRAFLDEAVMLILGETLVKWIYAMQSASVDALRQQIKKILEEAQKEARNQATVNEG